MEQIFLKEYADRYLDVSEIPVKKLNRSYSNRNERCKLDIYYPLNSLEETSPVIVFFHGGAFLKGDKSRYQLYSALQGVANGFVVVSVNYRLLPEFSHKDYLLDAKEAVDYIYLHAKELKIDSENIFLWGESAGAFLALNVGLTNQNQKLRKYLKMESKNDYAIKGIVSWYAPTNLLTHPDIQVLDNQSLNFLKYRQTGTDLQKTLFELSPIQLVNKQMPRLIIQHGLKDTVVMPNQALELAQAASEYLDSTQLYIDFLIDAEHTTNVFSDKENLSVIFQRLNQWKGERDDK